jgi:ABC-type transport system involved in cytochrome c biogenesis permease subunit
METTWRHDSAALAELEDHLREHFDALTLAGHSEQEAWSLATAKLGSPAEVAREFAKVHRLSRLDRAVLCAMVGAALAVVGALVGGLYGANPPLANQPLLASHVATITLGYLSGLLAASVAGYAIVRSLMRPASTAALRDATLKVVRSASVAACVLSMAGFVLGAIWAEGAWGRAFTGLPREIGALLVIGIFAALAVVTSRHSWAPRTQLAMAAIGGGAVLAAWFGAAAVVTGDSTLLPAIGFGGLEASLALAALLLVVVDRPRAA